MMKADELGRSYDRISAWWDKTAESANGLSYLKQAIGLSKQQRQALDVGCGSGGRMIETMLAAGYALTGLDVSSKMLALAAAKHPEAEFIHIDFMVWASDEAYDLVVAWDSIFHAPQTEQADVLKKLCAHLAPGGVLLFTGGDADGERAGEMQGVPFEYGSISSAARIKIMEQSNCEVITAEYDQPEHMVFVCIKKQD